MSLVDSLLDGKDNLIVASCLLGCHVSQWFQVWCSMENWLKHLCLLEHFLVISQEVLCLSSISFEKALGL